MNLDQGRTMGSSEESPCTASKMMQRLSISIFLVGLHSVTLGFFIFFFTNTFYQFFFGVAVDNLFLLRQAGLFLFCLGLFYLVPLTDLSNSHRAVDLIILTKLLAVLFLLNNAWLVAKPEPLFLAAAGDALMACLLIFFSAKTGMLLKRSQRKEP